MSIHYYVYAEVNVEDKWYNLNPTMEKPDGSFSVRPIYDSSSVFFDIINDPEEKLVFRGIPDDMSPVKTLFRLTNLQRKKNSTDSLNNT